jgi:hypothetical protein
MVPYCKERQIGRRGKFVSVRGSDLAPETGAIVRNAQIQTRRNGVLMKRLFVVLALLLCCAVPLSASDGYVSSILAPLQTDFQQTYCDPAMYAPALYPLPNGDMGMITQGNCLNHCDNGMGDSLFRWRRAVANGTWNDNNGGITPSMFQKITSRGETIPAGGLNGFKQVIAESPMVGDPCPSTNALSTFNGAYGQPAVVSLNGKLYMASERGNGDWWNGEVWWAVSSDNGATWTQQSQPLVYGFNHRGHQSNANCVEGFASISMTTTTDASGTWFHIYGTYFHPSRELPGSAVSSVDYRILYNSANSFGLGATKQILSDGAYINNSGKFVWSYDAGNPQPGDTKLAPGSINASWSSNNAYFFTTSVTKIGSTYYMVVAKWDVGNDPIYLSTSCDGTHWSATPLVIDTSSIYGAYPNHLLVNNAIYYGNLDGAPALWGFFSLGNYCNINNAYSGTRILPVKIALTVGPSCP